MDGKGGAVRSEKEEVTLEEILKKLSGTITYSDEDITRIKPNRDANGYIETLQFYAGTTLKFTITLEWTTIAGKKRVTDIVRS